VCALLNCEYVAHLFPEKEVAACVHPFFKFSVNMPLKEMFDGEVEESDEIEEIEAHGNRFSATGK
jgi:hypothetical protein